MMLHGNRAILAIAILPVLALGLAACGGADDSNTNAGGAPSGATGGETVTTKSIAGVGDVLVDSTGAVLYTNDMDSRSKIACMGECTTEWIPLSAPSGGSPTSSDSAVEAELGTAKRPDGTSQVTFGGLPLYTFVEDGPGQATGDGFSDSFGGTNFVWTAASAGGGAPGSGAATTTSGTSAGGGVRGY
jgi:predicted lipoprotein with Yx(FWY)xxD motif